MRPHETIKVFRAIILGPPGSGKGTIASRIVRDFGFKHLSSGDLLRSQIQRQTPSGVEARQYIETGQLVPDHLVIKLVINELSTSFLYQNWLLDGFPLTVVQAEALDKHYKIDSVMNLNVPDDEIIERVKGRLVHLPSGRIYHLQFNPPKVAGHDDVTNEKLTQREDDKPETVKARLQTYKLMSEPVIRYYRNENVLTEFNGKESNEIWPRVKKYLSDAIQTTR